MSNFYGLSEPLFFQEADVLCQHVDNGLIVTIKKFLQFRKVVE